MNRAGSRRRTKHAGTKFRKTDILAAVAGIRGAVRFDAPLDSYTSFKIGGPADVVVEPADVEDIRRLVTQARARGVPLFVVGGTNLLIRDRGIRGIVVHLGKLRAIREEPGEILYADGGAGMPTLIGYAVRRALAGLEWAAGIPGTVAGCVVMNAGTRLGEMKDALKAVRLVTASGVVRDIPASAIPFEYRRARLPKGIVVGVWLQLRKGIKKDIERVVKEYLHYRRDTQPLTLPSAGCVFKNPINDSAGRLIETLKLKGLRVGDAEVSTRHGNFIVNRGHARAADVVALIGKVRRAIKRQAGVRLDLELRIVGEAGR
ncbi:UDP-N-acetylenolpyruvoylglucosamine reductase [Nitrospira japonica]|uniref:UDP-N-acetylenolpyruvoylglucosamine reductase n=1 Tax=Nitrospira japonica TaxID=1325564 RepID=A0A1W1I4F5_9BACT|nr:UDP-N-acetylmuramate dehydrogenase [Nitrospira japonica]SLM47907.1 UDP-N-acetylenolpyruvoylglucosamine reductase [Nitrospira japonica]